MSMQATITILMGVFASMAALVVVNYMLLLPIPRSVPFIYAMLAMLSIGGVRLILRDLYHR
ncbi:hypothetical protein, partial [Streptomyces sp. P17]|uniref:hypothetical protein n=1 Tax=Streptomyces sp. P17 TaxID=3074716 RepID=UPI0028F42546